MTTIKTRFDGRVFVPEQQVNLPPGTEITICLPDTFVPVEVEQPLLELLNSLQVLPPNPDWPADGAEQHDHYLYGSSKSP